MKRNGFSERLKGLITQKGIAMSQIAQAIGVSATSVHRWTQGGEIEYENLLALANHLKVNWVWLRYGDEAIRLASEANPDTDAESNLRRQYLDQVMANERRMKTALEMAQIVNWEWNAISGTIICSANAKLVFGCEPESIREALVPFNKLSLEALSALFSGKQVYSWDFQLTAKEGAVRWFTSRAHLLADSNNIPIKVIAITADITERKETERALERSEYMLRKIIETMPVGLWVANKDGDITIANPEVKRIWGGAKMVGLEQYNLYKGKWAKDGSRLSGRDWTLARAVTKGETSKEEIVDIEAFDGVERTIIMFATPLLNNNNEIIGAIEVNQDITLIKQTEYLLKKSHDQLETLYRQDQFGVLHFSNAGIQRMSTLIATLLDKEPSCLENKPIDDIFDSETVATIAERKDSADLSAKIQGNILKSAGKSVAPVSVWIYLIKHPDYSVGGDMMAFLFPRKD